MADSAANDGARTIVAISGLGKRYGITSPSSADKSFLQRSKCFALHNPKYETDGVIWALRDFSLRIPAGTVTGIIGRNGAGKTTLLRILGRITAPTTGRIVGRGRVFPMLEVGASFHPDFTAYENIMFNAAMFGVPRIEVRRKLDHVIDFAGVGDRLDDKVRDMSNGTYIRLAFALAVTLQPDLLLADEVLAVGDAAFQVACIERIRAEKKRGMSVLFVSHDMAAVSDVCDRVVWIDNGRIRKIGSPEEIIASYEHELWQSKSRQIGDLAETDRPVRLLATRALGSAGHEVGAITQADALMIEVIIESHCASATVTPGVDIFCGPTLLISAWAPEPAKLIAPGIYSATMSVPQWTFSAREFHIRASIRVQPTNGAAYVAENDNVYRFKVHEFDRPDFDGKQRKRARAGYISPQLNWSMRSELAEKSAGQSVAGI